MQLVEDDVEIEEPEVQEELEEGEGLATLTSLVNEAAQEFGFSGPECTIMKLAGQGNLVCNFRWTATERETFVDVGIIMLRIVRLDSLEDVISNYSLEYIFIFIASLFYLVILVLMFYLPTITTTTTIMITIITTPGASLLSWASCSLSPRGLSR